MAETRADADDQQRQQPVSGAEAPSSKDQQRHQPVSGAEAPSSKYRRALESALAGGPARHHEKTAAQGKLPVRERVARLVDQGSFSEEALLANWEKEGLGADGVVTGIA